MASIRGAILGLIPNGFFSGPAAFINFTINSKTTPGIDRVAWSMQMPPDVASDTLTHIGFRYGARAGTPVAHDIGFQGWTTGGLPDGTFLGGGSPNKGPFTPPADTTWNSTWQWIALTNSYATSRGEQLMIVCEPTGEPDGSNNSSFTRHATWSSFGIARNFTQTDGAAFVSQNTYPVVAVKSATRVYGYPIEAAFSTNMGTAGHRQCNLLTFPSGSCTSKQVIGIEFVGLAAAAGSVILGVWNAAGTAQTAITVDTDRLVAASADRCKVYFDDAPVTLNAGTAYYFGMEYVDVACRIAGFDVAAAADMAAYPFGTGCYAASWNGSTWTETATRRHQMNLLVEDITSSAGGGKIWELDVSA